MKRTLFPLIAGILLGVASPAHSAPVPPPEKLLPADTLVMLTVPDWDKSSAALKDAPFNRLWRDPEMKPFVDHFNAGLQKEFVQPLEKELGFKLGEFTNLVHGQFTIGVVQDGWQGKTGEEPAFILLLDVKDQTSRLSKILADLRTKWNESGRKIKEETIRGVSFTVLMISPAEIGKSFDKSKQGDSEPPSDSTDKSKADKPFPLLVGQNGSLLLVGTSSRVIEQVLVRQGGGSVSSLSELASYEKNHTALFRDSNFSLWANARAFTDILLKSKPEADAGPNGNPLGYTPEKIVTALGLKGLRTVAMSAVFSDDGMLGRFAMTIPESERRGLFTILTPETKDASPLPFVQADVTKFNRWRLNGQKVWGTFETIVADMFPPVSGLLQMTMDMAGKDKDPNFDLKKSLIGNLGDDIITIQKAPKAATLTALSSPPTLVLIGSPRPEQFLSGFRTGVGALLPNATGGGQTERDFLGRKVYSTPLPPSNVPGQRPEVRALTYASSGSYLALSTDASLVEEYLRSSEGSGRSLRETPGLMEATEKVGGMGNGIFAYENQTAVARTAFQLLKLNPKAFDQMFNPAAAAGVTSDAGSRKDWFDFSLLPPFEKVEKYFHYSVFGGNVSPDGFLFRSFSPTPPELRK